VGENPLAPRPHPPRPPLASSHPLTLSLLRSPPLSSSRRYQYQATTAEEAMAGAEPSPFADFFQPTADSFVGSLAVRD